MRKAAGAVGGSGRVLGRWSRDEYSQVDDWEQAQRGTKSAARAKGPAREGTGDNAAPALRPGDKVKHTVFGQGVVVSVTGNGDDAQANVAFPNVGVKKLVLAYARLEKV